MKLSPRPRAGRATRRGSALVLVALITLAVGIVSGVLLRYAATESRLNRRNVMRLEAKNAAEAALEYGAAELATRLRADQGFNTSSLVSSPIGIHSARLGSLYASGSSAPTTVAPTDIRLYVGRASDPFSHVISKNDPNNAYDPLVGQIVRSRIIRLLASAPASLPGLGTTTAYATQAFEVRDSKLFNYAIFYNLRMEFHPGAAMEVWGPVHSNEAFHLSTAASLGFFDTVTTADRFIAAGFATGKGTAGNISFPSGYDPSGNLLTTSINGHSFRTSPTGNTVTYVDSQLGDRATGHLFSEAASQIWRGNLQDRSHGIERQTPPGVLNPNDARKLIQPPDPSNSLTTEQRSIEAQKFSRKAGLYVVVDRVAPSVVGGVLGGTTTPRVTVFTNATDALAFKSSANRALWLATNSAKVVEPPSGLVTTTRRLRDNRENKTVNMVDVDIGVLRSAVTTASPTAAQAKIQNAWTGAVYVEVEDPTRGFETTSDISVASGASSGSVHGAGTGTGTATAVRLLNGRRLPTRPSASSEAGLSFVTNAPVYVAGHYNANGSFGTAASPDGSERSPDPGWDNGTPNNPADDTEVPSLVAGDSINILSANWVDAAGRPVGDGRESNLNATKGREPVATEISTVFMGGIVETNPANLTQYSGGVENYFRLHENWANSDAKTLRYRGSIVALFTSAYATARWPGTGGNFYNAPRRRWGFHDFLKNDMAPPFTPTLRTFRRLDFRDISRAEFDTLLANASYGFTLMEPAAPVED
ncbi:MAG: hypothetical protein MUE42_03010 [Opitutaceae bacterium]|jgi:hypothetical protein|nr:hypothetical protein [Opitutaceae bacterium]